MIASCCLDKTDGKLRKLVPALRPPGPPTNFSHASCYLRETRDCSEQISREHYVSASVLQQLGGTIGVSGAPWLKPGETLKLAVNNLAAKILCRRHNEALSPLDEEAGRFCSALAATLGNLERNRSSRQTDVHLISGTMLELWMLKVACGVYFAVAANDGERLTQTHTIDLAKVGRAFFDGEWEPGGGLYFSGLGTVMKTAFDVSVAPLSDSAKTFCGVRTAVLGLTMELLFDTTNANPAPWTASSKRPSELVFGKKHSREQHIILTWPPGTPEQGIHFGEVL